MSEINKNKSASPLVQSVLALDGYFSELVRLGGKIDGMEIKSDFDLEQVQRLIGRFAECGQAVSTEVVQLSNSLNEARAQAETAAQMVSVRAEQLQNRKTEQQKKMDEFRLLGEKVRDLSNSLQELKQPEARPASDEDRAKLSMRLSEFELQLRPLIDEAQSLRESARHSKMKTLEQGADSLTQSLQAVSQKLSGFQQSNLAAH